MNESIGLFFFYYLLVINIRSNKRYSTFAWINGRGVKKPKTRVRVKTNVKSIQEPVTDYYLDPEYSVAKKGPDIFYGRCIPAVSRSGLQGRIHSTSGVSWLRSRNMPAGRTLFTTSDALTGLQQSAASCLSQLERPSVQRQTRASSLLSSLKPC